MQRERQNREDPINSRDPFDGFRDFASHRSMMPGIFGGWDPFDDPFFNRPFGSIFEPSLFDRHGSSDNLPNASSSKGLIIEELDSDDEGEKVEEEGNGDSELKKKKAQGGTTSSKDPFIEHPDDEEDVSKDVRVNSNHSKIEGTKPQTQSVYRKVTYGGINGAYYTATTTRKSGSDGVVLEESKQADKTTGQATHRISKGIHDKGHSVTRKLDTDGKVDTLQTLHNLNEDELAGFEQAWRGDADRQLPGWNEEFINSFGRAGSGSMPSFGFSLPSIERSQSGGRMHENKARASSSGGRTKKVVTINIE